MLRDGPVRRPRPERGPAGRPVARQGGIALIVVVWLLALLSVIAMSSAFGTRTEMLVAASNAGQARWAAAADAGFHRAIFWLLLPADSADRLTPDGVPREFSWEGLAVVVQAFDESGRVDLNAANPELLRVILTSLGLSDQESRALIDVMADWRDVDDLRRPAGAEADDYARQGSPYRPSNAPFQTIDELRQILGMNNDLFERLRPLVTVYSASPGINPAFAPREVLLRLPNADEAQVDAFLAARAAASEARQPIPVFPPAREFATNAGGGQAFTLRSTVIDAGTGRPRMVREAVVRLGRDPSNPVAFAYVRTLQTGDTRALVQSSSGKPDGKQ